MKLNVNVEKASYLLANCGNRSEENVYLELLSRRFYLGLQQSSDFIMFNLLNYPLTTRTVPACLISMLH